MKQVFCSLDTWQPSNEKATVAWVMFFFVLPFSELFVCCLGVDQSIMWIMCMQDRVVNGLTLSKTTANISFFSQIASAATGRIYHRVLNSPEASQILDRMLSPASRNDNKNTVFACDLMLIVYCQSDIRLIIACGMRLEVTDTWNFSCVGFIVSVCADSVSTCCGVVGQFFFPSNLLCLQCAWKHGGVPSASHDVRPRVHPAPPGRSRMPRYGL